VTSYEGQSTVSALRQQIEPFLRNELGCRCPDEVLLDIRVVDKPSAFAGLPVDYALEIGGRLLVVVCLPGPCSEISGQLEALVHQGRQARDQGGLNRFRLVVPALDQGVAAQELQNRCSALTGGDGRTHLHVVAPAALPSI